MVLFFPLFLTDKSTVSINTDKRLSVSAVLSIPGVHVAGGWWWWWPSAVCCPPPPDNETHFCASLAVCLARCLAAGLCLAQGTGTGLWSSQGHSPPRHRCWRHSSGCRCGCSKYLDKVDRYFMSTFLYKNSSLMAQHYDDHYRKNVNIWFIYSSIHVDCIKYLYICTCTSLTERHESRYVASK